MMQITAIGLPQVDGWLKAYRTKQAKATRSALRKTALFVAKAERAALGAPQRLRRGEAQSLRSRGAHIPGALRRSIRPGRPRLIGGGMYRITVGPGRSTRLYRSVQEARKGYVRRGVATASPALRTVFVNALNQAAGAGE